LAASLPPPYRRYCELRNGLGQICALIATAEGVKPVMDDWVPAARLDQLADLASGLGLSWVADEVFTPVEDGSALEGVVGADLLNTTRATLGRADEDGDVHVYLGRDEDDVEAASRAGWYDLVVGGRVVPKPFVDHLWLGERFGYPACCLERFGIDGEWTSGNAYAAAMRRTNRPRAWCNPAMRHTGLVYSVHYPCAFDCPASFDLACRVRTAVGAVSPALLQATDALVSGCYLLLSGWVGFRFEEARLLGDRVSYLRCRAVPTNNVDQELEALLERGSALAVNNDVLVVFDLDGRALGTRQLRADGYAPEHATLVEFPIEDAGVAPELVS
jgi:hypothetical protein